MRNLMRGLMLVLTLAGLAGNSFSQGRGGGFAGDSLEPAIHPLAENVEILRLENGMDVILMRNPGQPMVGVYTQVKVGSAWEDYRTSGMSHMLEHLLFNGSDKYTQEELYDKADQAGAYNNANTARFFTNFMMVVPAAALETGLDLQSQMLFHSLIPADKFEKEKGIVVGELVQARDWPGHAKEKALEQALWEGSSLELPTLGTKSTIEHMERDDVYQFYRKWYVPNNMVLTLAGNFDRDEALALLETYYGGVAPGTVERSPLRPVRPIENATSASRRVGDERVLALAFDAPSYGLPDYFPFLVLTSLLDLEGTGILTAALDDLPAAERPELATWWEQSPGFGRLVLEFTLPEGVGPDGIYRLVQDALTGAMEMGITGEDILGIVRTSETHTLLEREQLRMTGIYTAEPIVLGGIDFFVSFLDGLRAVTAEDVSRTLANWLIDAPCQAVYIEPAAGAAGGAGGMAGMRMPPGMQMPPAMAAAMGGKEGGAADKPAAPKPAAPAPLQVDRSELANGAVLVSQTNPDSPLMAIHLAVKGRAAIDRENAAAGAVDLVHRLIGEGYAGCDRACLARQLRRLGAVVKVVDDDRIPMDNYYTTGRFSFVRIEATAANGPEILALLLQQLQFASFTAQDFARVRDERVEKLEQEKASARATANGLLEQGLYGDHPLVMAPEGTPESLASLDFNQVRQVYRKAFSPDNLVFAVVGPQTHAELKAAIESGLPGRSRPGPTLPVPPATTAGEELTATVGGQMTAIRLGAVLDVAPADAAALELTVAILSDRMAMDLRETRGLSYSVGASLDVTGPVAEFTAWLNPPQERLAEGQAAIREFVAGFDAATITREEMDKIRSARRGRLMMRRLSSMGQAYYLAMAELDGDIAGYLNGLTAYDDLTLSDLQRVAGKYLATMPLVEVIVN
ncbi:insulinase family protein [bacterium]|nr:insulinase family protein [bacterium]